MRTTLPARLTAAAVLMFTIAVPAVHADRTITEKARVIYHFARIEVMAVGDVPGHIVALADQRGLTTIDTGEVGVWASKGYLDLTNGIGPHQTYTVTTFADKSTVVTQSRGITSSVAADGSSSFEGTSVIVGGTGRFAGIKGTGTYRGKRMAPITPGGQADAWLESEATYTLPDR